MGISTWKIENGEIKVTNNSFVTITDEAALAQALEGMISMFVGEWFLDEERGIDWIDVLSTKPFRVQDFEPILRTRILSHPAVTDITSLVVTPNNTTRILTIAFEVASDVGLVQGGVTVP